jgi:hypothetical protein
MPKSPNPQGKGLIPVLNELDKFRFTQAEPKSFEKISSEIFTALFVLESHFKFCPRPKQTYHLYKKGKEYFLSLISDQDWGTSRPYSDYVGECELHEDMAWTINLSENINQEIVKEIELKFKQYQESLLKTEIMDDILPKYVEKASFYQRALIWSLGKSLKGSMKASGYLGQSIGDVLLLEQKNGP